jgi:hypothetical protein
MARLRDYKKLAEDAMAQATDEQLLAALDHRWREAGPPSRHRVRGPAPTREALMALRQTGWDCVFRALEPLSDADLGRQLANRAACQALPAWPVAFE